MQCNMLDWDSFKSDNQTADSLWAVIMTTRCHRVNESPCYRRSNDNKLSREGVQEHIIIIIIIIIICWFIAQIVELFQGEKGENVSLSATRAFSAVLVSYICPL